MKSFARYLLTTAMGILPVVTFAQPTISEGKVVYAITYPDMELDSQVAGMLPTESTVFFKGNFSRTDMPAAMGMSSSIIINSKTNEITSLVDMMGVKTATVMANDELEKKQDKNATADLQFELVNETREISGYPCKKAILKNQDGSMVELFYTDKIQTRSQFSSQWKDFKGFPMEYEVDMGGMNIRMTAKSVSAEKVPDEIFTIPADYKVMTREEFSRMMGGEQE